MNIRSSFILFLLLAGSCFVYSCDSSRHLLTVSSAEKAASLQAVLRACNLNSSIRIIDGRSEIYTDSSLLVSATILISQLSYYFPEVFPGTANAPTLDKYFVPRLKSDDSLSAIIKQAEQIKRPANVLALRCVKDADALICSFLKTGELEISPIESYLKSLVPSTISLRIKTVDVDEFCGVLPTINLPSAASDVTVLEPFSFHVLVTDVWIASVQLIVLLGIFLISGVILGLLVARYFNGDRIEY